MNNVFNNRSKSPLIGLYYINEDNIVWRIEDFLPNGTYLMKKVLYLNNRGLIIQDVSLTGDFKVIAWTALSGQYEGHGELELVQDINRYIQNYFFGRLDQLKIETNIGEPIDYNPETDTITPLDLIEQKRKKEQKKKELIDYLVKTGLEFFTLYNITKQKEGDSSNEEKNTENTNLVCHDCGTYFYEENPNEDTVCPACESIEIGETYSCSTEKPPC